MKPWPFSEEEWFSVSETARAMVNATFAEDGILRESSFEELKYILNELQSKYGSHPVLLETEADFTRDPSIRVELYQRVKEIAITGEWITYSIRISLARVLLEEFADPHQALLELIACEVEIEDCADDWDCKEWQELMDECNKKIQR